MTMKHALNFFAASAAASFALRWQPIEKTVQAVRVRKAARTKSAMPEESVIADLFEIFRALRPLYPRPYLCLFDGLALLHFLARYDMFPEWVFGVKVEPFGAHCWVQAGNVVINDIVDTVRDYKPIMSV